MTTAVPREADIRCVVVGMGVQGEKRKFHAGQECVATVDPVRPADYTDLRDVPLSTYNAALLCVPDDPKVDLLDYLLSNGKHALVEKPLWASSPEELERVAALAASNSVVCYTAYNHRFEPHFMRIKSLFESGALGKIYSCRMFYGNGTAKLVRDSVWRDKGAGVLPDLGSHLLDTCQFWFGDLECEWQLAASNRFENRAPDHVIIAAEGNLPRIELEMTLCMWRNHFTCDILAEKGTAHIRSLCKWGPSTFTHRTRVFPSGRPSEISETLVQPDPTWATEYEHFKGLIASGRVTDLRTDIWLQNVLSTLGEHA